MLKLDLENFGCHRADNSFQFEGPGLVLLQGPSGSGKTSLLLAIAFCLYGELKKISWGEKTCKVTLDYDGWIITRKKGPNHLILIDDSTKEEYEDQEAQDLINQKYGTNFLITSFITQDGACSFFNLSPTKRMVFLEDLALGDVPIAEIKKKCSAKIRERKTKLSEHAGELKVIMDEVSRLTKPDLVMFPLADLYPEYKKIQNKITNESNLKKKNTKALIKSSKDLTDLVAHHSEHQLHSQRKEQFISQRETISQQLDKFKIEVNSLPKHNTVEIESRLKLLTLNKDLIKLKSSYDADSLQHKAMCMIELDQLKEEYDLLSEHPIIGDISTELQFNLKSKERYIKLTHKINTATSSISELDSLENYTSAISDILKREDELITQKLKFKDLTTIHKCPKCQTFLRLGKSGLEFEPEREDVPSTISIKDIENELKQIRSDRSDYEDSIRELKALQLDLTKLTKERDTLPQNLDLTINYESLYNTHKDVLREQDARKDRIIQLKRRIDNKEFSSTTQALSRRLELKLSEIKKMEYISQGSILPDDDPESLQKELFTAQTADQTRNRLTSQIKQLDIQLTSIQTQIDSIKLKDLDYPSLINDKNIEIKELKIAEKAFKERELKITAFLAYQEKQEAYDKWQSRLKNAEEEENNAKRSLAVAEKFLRKVKETECTAVINIIDTINSHMRSYLDEFFTDPIDVEISSFKEVKNSGDEKPIVNVRIFYKGYDCEVKDLSGGERARLSLAICLSINSMSGGSLILLDESFSSLNSEITEEILELLKEKIKENGKLVISVCHQTSESLFDSQVNLN